ncbi:MAG: MFS transporter [Ruminococcaceae bacterium]|nr:MFS transporter [Oscillospiraceae bacterium]
MFSMLLVLIYICFISLGLPDSLLGSAWPVMQQEIAVPMSYAGIVSMVISLGTIVSSLISEKVIRRFGTGVVTAVSVAMTAVALFGFSVSNSFLMLILWAVPYGLGGGAVDAALNNYVALHYKAQHMSWLHCFWGVGASISPYTMSFALVKLESWNYGYLMVSIIQIILSVFIFLSLPMWKQKQSKLQNDGEDVINDNLSKSLSLREIIKVPGAVSCFVTFFLYCAIEVSASLWASSYLVQCRGVSPKTASAFASLFYIGLMVGRAINGFLAMKLSDKFLVRMGSGIILCGVLLMLIPGVKVIVLIGFIITGLGCAPIYPCMIHMTPDLFGRKNSQSMIGIQMAFAYCGFLIMPPSFGLIADYVSISLLPVFLLMLLILMFLTHEYVVRKTR